MTLTTLEAVFMSASRVAVVVFLIDVQVSRRSRLWRAVVFVMGVLAFLPVAIGVR